METEYNSMFIYAIICSIIMIVLGIVGMIKNRHDKNDLAESFCGVLVGFFPPFAMLLMTLLLCGCLMWAILQIPTQIFKLFKQNNQ